MNLYNKSLINQGFIVFVGLLLKFTYQALILSQSSQLF